MNYHFSCLRVLRDLTKIDKQYFPLLEKKANVLKSREKVP